MDRRQKPPAAKRQAGIALLVFLYAAVVAALSVIISSISIRSNVSGNETDMRTLALAKEALIGWSATHSTAPGMLPCPEDTSQIGTANEGRAQSSCSNALPLVGRLPWRTLGLPELRDSAGEPLWYAISPGFRYAPINSETPGQLVVDSIANSAAAIIFSPGGVLTGQTRTVPSAASPPDVAQYLDGLNNSGTGQFISRLSGAPFNDRLVILSSRELFSVVARRVAREVRRSLLDYFCGSGNFDASGSCLTPGGNRFFPRPAIFSDTTCLGTGGIATLCNSGVSNNAGRIPANPTVAWTDIDPLSLLRGTITSTPNWFQKNGWRELVYYAVANACIDGTSNCSGTGMATVNRPPGLPDTNQKFVVIVAGSALATQVRATSTDKANVANYLEDENLLPLDDTYTRFPTIASSPFNDVVISQP